MVWEDGFQRGGHGSGPRAGSLRLGPRNRVAAAVRRPTLQPARRASSGADAPCIRIAPGRGPCRGVRTPDAPAIWPPSPAVEGEAETGPAPHRGPGESPKLPALPATVSCRLPNARRRSALLAPRLWAKHQAPYPQSPPRPRQLPKPKPKPKLRQALPRAVHGQNPTPAPAIPASVPHRLPMPKPSPALPAAPRQSPDPPPAATLCAPPQKPAACHIPATAPPPGPRARLTPGTGWGNRARHPGNGVSLRALGPGNLPLSVSRS